MCYAYGERTHPRDFSHKGHAAVCTESCASDLCVPKDVVFPDVFLQVVYCAFLPNLSSCHQSRTLGLMT